MIRPTEKRVPADDFTWHAAVCRRKRRCRTRRQAKALARSVEKLNPGVAMRIYECGVCGHFHLKTLNSEPDAATLAVCKPLPR